MVANLTDLKGMVFGVSRETRLDLVVIEENGQYVVGLMDRYGMTRLHCGGIAECMSFVSGLRMGYSVLK